jgi:serine/threonine-protein kinase
MAAAFALLLRSAFASGADPSEADRARATGLFRDGRALMAAKRYADACPLLEESQRLDPGGGTLLNVALCHELQGRTATAWSDFQEALSLAEHDGRADRASAAQSHLRDLEPRLARLAIEVPPEARVPGLTVRRDGAELAAASWNIAYPIDSGEHVVEAEAPGRSPWRGTIAIRDGATSQTVRVPVLEPLPPIPVSPQQVDAPAMPAAVPPFTTNSEPQAQVQPAAQPPAPAESFVPSPRAWQRPLAIGVGVAGVIGLGVGTVFGLQASSQWNDAQPNCNGGTCRTPGAHQSWQDARSSASTATAAFVLGGLAVAGSVALWLTAPTAPVRAGATPGGLVARAEF